MFEGGDSNVNKDALDVLGLGCDVASEESMKQVFDKVVSRFGSINAVVASAGKVNFDSHPSAIINYRTKGICEHYAALEYVKIKTDKSFAQDCLIV